MPSSLVLEPPKGPFGWYKVDPYPRPFPPVRSAPPLPAHLPALPFPPRAPTAISETYLLSTHIIPAAWPRVTPATAAPLEPAPSPSAGREERKRVHLRRADAIIDVQRRHAEAVTPLGAGDAKVHWNCVNRYVRRDLGHGSRKGVTLFLAHGTGMHKEIWEPALQYLLANPGTQVDEIWAIDAVQHGDSALLNQAVLSEAFDWMDNARDVVSFLVHYLPTQATASALPLHLPRLPAAEALARESDGLGDRTLVAIGHSMGGTSVTIAALHFPALFSALVLIDPIILRGAPDTATGTGADRWAHRHAHVLQTLQRRAAWPSRAAAHAALGASGYFGAWHPRVLARHVDFGLAPTGRGKGEVALKTAPAREAAVFAESYLPCEAYERLDGLDARVEMLWVVPGEGEDPGLDGLEGLRARVWRRPVNTTNVRVAGVGHLILQEKPEELAMELRKFLERKYGRQEADKARL
ncbi:alpha/beta-hydrolase [Athelia psychrophila]|uniref:Alpha/beta-hydrolase n=1 Tax=Athelia psychrophila TaxID=1759441 RepID=A0A166RHI4_9AGAM|nr:alpha/beta-hydrolase [Fibularhizoctonia sp. CBS 109695]